MSSSPDPYLTPPRKTHHQDHIRSPNFSDEEISTPQYSIPLSSTVHPSSSSSSTVHPSSSSSSLGKRPIKGTNSTETVSYGSPISKHNSRLDAGVELSEVTGSKEKIMESKPQYKTKLKEKKTVKANDGVKPNDGDRIKTGRGKIKKRQLEDEVDLENDENYQAMDVDPPKRHKFTPQAEIVNARPRRNVKGKKAGD